MYLRRSTEGVGVDYRLDHDQALGHVLPVELVAVVGTLVGTVVEHLEKLRPPQVEHELCQRRRRRRRRRGGEGEEDERRRRRRRRGEEGRGRKMKGGGGGEEGRGRKMKGGGGGGGEEGEEGE